MLMSVNTVSYVSVPTSNVIKLSCIGLFSSPLYTVARCKEEVVERSVPVAIGTRWCLT